MKKNLLLTLFALILSIVFISCSDDDTDNSESEITGKWQLISSTNPDLYEECDYKNWTWYKSDGSYEYYLDCDNSVDKGTWKYKDGYISIIADIFPIVMKAKIVSVTSDKLIVELYDILEEKSYQDTYKRIE